MDFENMGDSSQIGFVFAVGMSIAALVWLVFLVQDMREPSHISSELDDLPVPRNLRTPAVSAAAYAALALVAFLWVDYNNDLEQKELAKNQAIEKEALSDLEDDGFAITGIVAVNGSEEGLKAELQGYEPGCFYEFDVIRDASGKFVLDLNSETRVTEVGDKTIKGIDEVVSEIPCSMSAFIIEGT